MSENLREVVNGKLLQQFSGKKVSIIGRVKNVASNGLSFEMMAVDDVPVKVILKRPHNEPIEGLVEILGTSQGSAVVCEELIAFIGEDGQDVEFDTSAQNSLCMLLNSAPRIWDTE